jgi:hypothetical protein
MNEGELRDSLIVSAGSTELVFLLSDTVTLILGPFFLDDET